MDRGYTELQAVHDAARDAHFAQADADGDGLLNETESEVNHHLDRAWRIERYGADGYDLTEEEGQAWWEAMNNMTPGTNGYSLDDHKRMELICKEIVKDPHGGTQSTNKTH